MLLRLISRAALARTAGPSQDTLKALEKLTGTSHVDYLRPIGEYIHFPERASRTTLRTLEHPGGNMAVLRTEPLGWASSGVRILSGERELTTLAISVWKGRGSFEVDGDAFTIDSQGFFRADAVLKKGSSVIARVKHTGFFGRRFEISSAGHRMVLEGQGWMGRSYVLRLMDRDVGRIKREGFTGKKISLEFPDQVPVFLQVLIVYVVLSQARREAAAAGG